MKNEPLYLCPVTLDECEDLSMKRQQRCSACDVVRDCTQPDDNNYKDLKIGENAYYVHRKRGVRCAQVASIDMKNSVVELLEYPDKTRGFIPYDLCFATIDEAIENELDAYREWLNETALDCMQEFEEAGHE